MLCIAPSTLMVTERALVGTFLAALGTLALRALTLGTLALCTPSLLFGSHCSHATGWRCYGK